MDQQPRIKDICVVAVYYRSDDEDLLDDDELYNSDLVLVGMAVRRMEAQAKAKLTKTPDEIYVIGKSFDGSISLNGVPITLIKEDELDQDAREIYQELLDDGDSPYLGLLKLSFGLIYPLPHTVMDDLGALFFLESLIIRVASGNKVKQGTHYEVNRRRSPWLQNGEDHCYINRSTNPFKYHPIPSTGSELGSVGSWSALLDSLEQDSGLCQCGSIYCVSSENDVKMVNVEITSAKSKPRTRKSTIIYPRFSIIDVTRDGSISKMRKRRRLRSNQPKKLRRTPKTTMTTW